MSAKHKNFRCEKVVKTDVSPPPRLIPDTVMVRVSVSQIDTHVRLSHYSVKIVRLRLYI